MSTRCQIKLRSADPAFKDDGGETNIYIYKHSDGYPEGVIPYLYPIVQKFHKKRGCSDGSYLLCQIVRHIAVMEHKEAVELISKGKGPFLEDTKKDWESDPTFLYNQGYLGWGLDCVSHGDIDYLYEVDSEGNIYINNKKQTTKQLEKWCEEGNK